ncbi:hypothetical protein KUCAC02_037625, partial [Chaenocephalus aceratus]
KCVRSVLPGGEYLWSRGAERREPELLSLQSAGLLQQTAERLHQEDEESDQAGPEHQLQTAIAT